MRGGCGIKGNSIPKKSTIGERGKNTKTKQRGAEAEQDDVCMKEIGPTSGKY